MKEIQEWLSHSTYMDYTAKLTPDDAIAKTLDE